MPLPRTPNTAGSVQVDPAEVSVVVQGPIVRDGAITERALKSVRAALPGSEIILSTWDGSETAGLNFDRLVTSPDPGGMYLFLPATPLVANNLSRLMVSTQAGLNAVSRPYTLKFRTDLELSHAGFLSYYRKYRARAEQWQLFTERIVIPDHFARNPARKTTRLPAGYTPAVVHTFHPSDMAGFGRTEDVKRFWDVPLPPLGSELPPPERNSIDPALLSKRFIRTVSEQYLWTEALRRAFGLTVKPVTINDPEMRVTSEMTLVNNFTILRRSQFGVLLPKHPFNQGHWSSLYTYRDFVELYRKYCDPTAALPFDFAHALKNFTYMGRWTATPFGSALRWVANNVSAIERRL